MAITLLQTLYWGSDPTHTLDVFQGSCSISRNITAAESHDSNNATFAQMLCAGDLSDAGLSSLVVESLLQTCNTTGTISKVIVYSTIKSSGNYASNDTYFQFNGTQVGNVKNPTIGFVEYSEEFLTIPSGGAWNKSAINSATWGLFMSGTTVDENSSMSSYHSEFRVEVWGEEGEVITPTTAARAIGLETGNRWWSS